MSRHRYHDNMTASLSDDNVRDITACPNEHINATLGSRYHYHANHHIVFMTVSPRYDVIREDHALQLSNNSLRFRFERQIGLYKSVPITRHAPEVSTMNRVVRDIPLNSVISRDDTLFQLSTEDQESLSDAFGANRRYLSSLSRTQYHYVNSLWAKDPDFHIFGCEEILGELQSKRRPKASRLPEVLFSQLCGRYEALYQRKFTEIECPNEVFLANHQT